MNLGNFEITPMDMSRMSKALQRKYTDLRLKVRSCEMATLYCRGTN